MTLRTRLTGAFLAVIMGPVLVGGVFVAVTVDAVNHTHERDRLDLAAATTRMLISAACDRLESAAEAAATATAAGAIPDRAQTLVDQGLAGAIHIENASGEPIVTTARAPQPPWALCTPPPATGGVPAFGGVPASGGVPVHAPPTGGIPAYDPPTGGPYSAFAAVVEMRDPAGAFAGYAYAAQMLSPAYVSTLATAADAQITVVDVGSGSAGSGASASSVGPDLGGKIAAYAASLPPNRTGMDLSRYVRRIDPAADQPLDIAVSVPVRPTGGLFAIVIAVAAFAAIAAVAAAWALARTATKPLDEITEAAERIAEGDLATRVPVRHDDEVGHVGAALNRLSREMQSYSTALSNSREQLRGNLDILGDTLASTHDLPRILRVILASAISATGAKAGLVLLTEPDGRLRMRCSVGFDSEAPAQLAASGIAPGDGLLGAVAASAIARRGRVAEYAFAEHTSGPQPIDAEPVCRTYLAVPLRSPAASPTLAVSAHGIGILALYDRLGDADFDDADLRTVRSFASHAAVAVDNVRAHAEAQRLSHTDPLTGLYNYRRLKDLVRLEVERSHRFGRKVCVLLLDLDRFKDVNDSYGHAAGDAVLVEFARRIRAEIRGVDLAFRYGGEEFVLLLPETDGLGGVTLAQRLGAAIRETTFAIAGRFDSDTDMLVNVTVSIGVAVFPEHGDSGTRLLEAADDALYAAKAAGRDTYRLAIVHPALVSGAVSGAASRAPGGASGITPPPRQARGR